VAGVIVSASRGHACIAVGLSVRVGGELLEGTHCAQAGVQDWPAGGHNRRGRLLRKQESLEGMRKKEDKGQDGSCANCGGKCRLKRISKLNAGSVELKRTCITKSRSKPGCGRMAGPLACLGSQQMLCGSKNTCGFGKDAKGAKSVRCGLCISRAEMLRTLCVWGQQPSLYALVKHLWDDWVARSGGNELVIG
jgi:hypothetical protein